MSRKLLVNIRTAGDPVSSDRVQKISPVPYPLESDADVSVPSKHS